MLARQFRLPATVSFQHAKVFHSAFFTLRSTSNALSNSRFGFIAGKKIDKRSVVRNKVKRKIRSCIEEKWLSLKGYDILFAIKKGAIEASRDEVCKEVGSIMEKLSINRQG